MTTLEKSLNICYDLDPKQRAYFERLPDNFKEIIDVIDYDPRTKTLFPTDEIVKVPSLIGQIKATYHITKKYGLYRALVWNLDITDHHIFGEGGVLDRIIPF
ncbi:MAG: hypothetical protein KAT77_02760 [Nanoarchaeota archaeon]|nr:hypothetical protein [Nanoarchaeota archaeon]